MLYSAAPQAKVVFDAVADLAADRAVRIGYGAGLPPLVVNDPRVIFSNDVLAVRFPQFSVSADLVDYDATFFALQNIGEESVGEFVAEVAEIERLLFGGLPLMLR